MLKITPSEYTLMKQYIETNCGIRLENGKEYLIESRLGDLSAKNGCNSFKDFYHKATLDSTGKLKDQIIDSMTTNETLWFRDNTTWQYLKEVAVPELIDKAQKQNKIRIWSAASSTGQEIYSLLMLFDEAVKKRGTPSLIKNIEFIATDISSSALNLAKAAKYNSIAMNRGIQLDKKDKYFVKENDKWAFDKNLKTKVNFKLFNLQSSFNLLGNFDLILCRYVIIYFSDDFKKQLFKKLYNVLKPQGVLLLGASESLRGYSNDFTIDYFKNTVLNIKK